MFFQRTFMRFNAVTYETTMHTINGSDTYVGDRLSCVRVAVIVCCIMLLVASRWAFMDSSTASLTIWNGSNDEYNNKRFMKRPQHSDSNSTQKIAHHNKWPIPF